MLRSHGILQRALRSRPPRSRPSQRCLSQTAGRWSSRIEQGDGQDSTSCKLGQVEGHPPVVAAPDICQDEQPKKRRGRPRKTAPGDDTTTKEGSKAPEGSAIPTRPRRRKTSIPDLPPRLTDQASPHHNSLATFLRHANDHGLNPGSTVYRGTHYEYTCVQTLSSQLYSFELHRTGRANDLGIDLVGRWKLPAERSADEVEGERHSDGARKHNPHKHFRDLKVLAQCKLATAPKPAMVRELEGAFAGAPAGWNDSESVLALLLCTAPATKGVIEGLQRSRLPMGWLQLTAEGEVKQFLWNAVAAGMPQMHGMGVVVRYAEDKSKVEVRQSVRLSWKGRVWSA